MQRDGVRRRVEARREPTQNVETDCDGLTSVLFPTTAVGIGFAAVKWTRGLETPSDAPEPKDPRLEERLDDELRNLD